VQIQWASPARQGIIMRIPTIKACKAMEGLSDQALEQVAHYFQALAEPNRLRILNLLREREHNVGEIAQLCGSTTANISRHLALLAKNGMVVREGRGTSVYYRIADANIYALCDLVCGSIARRFEAQASAFE
jgi:DNA-binding transcriptional ArsR family regulator